MTSIQYIDFSEYMVKPPKGLRETSWGYVWPGQSISGYGKKITTAYMVRPEGAKRFYRVYHTIYSNCGSMWITVKGQRYYLRDTSFDMALEVVE